MTWSREHDYIIASAIDKAAHTKQYGKLGSDVYDIAFTFVLERSVFFLDEQHAGDKRLHIIIEKRGKKKDSALQKHFQQLCTRGTGYVSPERIHAYATDIEFKAKMEEVNELQLADLTACPIARYVMDPTRANRAFHVLESKFSMKGGKWYGLKLFQ